MTEAQNRPLFYILFNISVNYTIFQKSEDQFFDNASLKVGSLPTSSCIFGNLHTIEKRDCLGLWQTPP